MSTGESANPEREELTLSEVSEKHKGKWVALVVTGRDRNAQPVRGRVVAEDVDRYRLREKTTKYDDICIFYAGDSPYRLLL
jgi:hypothetical protein